MTHQYSLTLFEVFKRPDEVGVGKLAGTVEQLLRENPRPPLRLKEGQHVHFYVLEPSSIHFSPGVVD
jgi:hypothetical protein